MDGITPTFFWKRGDEINGGAISLPLTLLEEDISGATLLYQCLVQNTSGSSIVIGTNAIAGGVRIIQPRMVGSQSILSKNPCLYFDTISGNIKYRNSFYINDRQISSGNSPDTSLMM